MQATGLIFVLRFLCDTCEFIGTKRCICGNRCSNGCAREGVLTACDADITDLYSASRALQVSREHLGFRTTRTQRIRNLITKGR
jgi:hypothetical protein